MDQTCSNLYIDGKWVGTRDDRGTFEVVNPATECAIGSVVQASPQDVKLAITAARRAFDEGPWSRTSPRDRAALLIRMAESLERRKSELVRLNIAEAGSVRKVAEIVQVQTAIDLFCDLAERVVPAYEFERPMLPGLGTLLGQGIVQQQAVGVAALITAFNFPLYLNLAKVGPALAAGCTVVLKPSPLTPFEALVLGEVADEIGLPPGVLNVVTGEADAAVELTSNPMVDIVSFTGSAHVGRSVMAQASNTVKKLVLELGGKSANIILPDANSESASASVIGSMTMHSGQVCGALSRTFVHESMVDDVVQRVADGLSLINIGDPEKWETHMGPVISSAQRDRVEMLVNEAVSEGAQIACGGGRPPDLEKGWFLRPTLLVNLTNESRIAQEEVFGPVGILIPFGDEMEAITLANQSIYGLAGGIWSNDTSKALQLARLLRTGTVSINGGGGGNPNAPFGGYKQSGLGRERGAAGISEFLETKSITWHVSQS